MALIVLPTEKDFNDRFVLTYAIKSWSQPERWERKIMNS
jgi:hypothetical protein